jgi:hypothetical protein
MTLPAMPGTAHRTGSRHRVVAIGLGWVGLSASKALKHDLVNITDVLVFLTRVTAQGTARVHNRTSLWPQVTLTAAAVLTTVGVFITLYVTAAVRGRKGTTQERSETATAATYLRCQRRRWHWRRTQKGWC